MPLIIDDYITKIFEGVHPSWMRLFRNGELGRMYNSAIANLNNDLVSRGVTKDNIKKNGLEQYIRPMPENILQAFKYFDINNTRAIIVGQDPYPELYCANGLAFSMNKEIENISASLKKSIYPALKESKFIDYIPAHGNLEEFAAQGVLMINIYLTRTPEITKDEKGVYINGSGLSNKKNIHKFWKEFTISIVNYITSGNLHTQHKIPVMLWGKHAQQISKAVGENGVILTWGHPSPAAAISATNPNHFSYCDNFIKANKILADQNLPEIIWNPDHVNDKIILKKQFTTYKLLNVHSNINEYIISLIQNKKIYNDMFSEENKFIKEYIESIKKQNEPKEENPEHLENLKQLEILAKASKAAFTAETTPETTKENPEISETTKENSEIPETTEENTEKVEIQEEQKEEPKEKEVVDSIVVFTDGSCPKNGKVDAEGGIGVYFPVSFNSISNGYLTNDESLSSTHIHGPLPRCGLAFNKNREIEFTNTEIKATNQRAELYALVTGLEHVIKKLKTTTTTIKPIIIVTDSEYAIKWISYLLWDNLIKNSKLDAQIANRDIVIMLYHSLSALYKLYTNNATGTPEEKRNTLIGKANSYSWKLYASRPKENKPPSYSAFPCINIVHVNSHTKGLPGTNYFGGVELNEDMQATVMELKEGNNEADRLANLGLSVSENVVDVKVYDE